MTHDEEENWYLVLERDMRCATGVIRRIAPAVRAPSWDEAAERYVEERIAQGDKRSQFDLTVQQANCEAEYRLVVERRLSVVYPGNNEVTA